MSYKNYHLLFQVFLCFIVNYASSKANADNVVKSITDNGGIAIAVQADVSKEADVIRLFEETNKAFGHWIFG